MEYTPLRPGVLHVARGKRQPLELHIRPGLLLAAMGLPESDDNIATVVQRLLHAIDQLSGLVAVDLVEQPSESEESV
jgi:hypothetical protein